MRDEDDEPVGEDLTDAQIAALRDALHAVRAEAMGSLDGAADNARPVELDSAIGRLTRMDALQQQQMAAERDRRLRLRLAQVQQALARIEEGAYGVCARCEEPIGYDRLVARPEAPLCRRCQR